MPYERVRQLSRVKDALAEPASYHGRRGMGGIACNGNPPGNQATGKVFGDRRPEDQLSFEADAESLGPGRWPRLFRYLP